MTSSIYKYLGAGQIVEEDYADASVKLSYLNSAGTNVTGLDRFGRVHDQVWENYDANRRRYNQPDASMGGTAGRKVSFAAFNESETAAYVEHRLRVAGSPRSIVDPDALPTLQELTNGIPRRINRLCDLALLVGYAEEQQMLDASHFESVCRELVAMTPE